MTALDFMLTCFGAGVLSVCLALSVKIVTDTRARVRVVKDLAQRKDEPIDPMGQRLQELRSATFGRRMVGVNREQTWPVERLKIKGPIPSPNDGEKK
jgi:hypothetical protein